MKFHYLKSEMEFNVKLEFCEISFQSHGLFGLLIIISIVKLGLYEIQAQSHGLSGLLIIISIVILEFCDI